MAMDAADYCRRWRQRKAGLLEPFQPLTCDNCGKNRSGKHGSICHYCWLKTPEGREWNKLRIQKYRQDKRKVV